MKALDSILLVVLLSLSTPLQASEGGSTAGDGGHGVSCLEDTKSTLRLLDLYEAEHFYGSNKTLFSPDPLLHTDGIYFDLGWNSDIAEIVQRAKSVLGPSHRFIKSIEDAANIEPIIHFTYGISPTKDFGFIPGSINWNCSITQIARRSYGQNGLTLIIDYDSWNQLLPRDRFALLLHESLHSWFSVFNTDTLAVRQAVIYLMADSTFRERNLILFKTLVESAKPINPTLFLSPIK